MKIIYITQTCPPEPGSTKRQLKEAEMLSALGHKVILITAFPSYPLGRVYEGYRNKLWSCEKAQGISIIRVWCVPAPNRGSLRRLTSFLTFSLSAAIAALCAGRTDVIIGSLPKPFSEFAAWLAARIKKSVFVIQLCDLMPDNLKLIGFKEKSVKYALLDSYFRWIYRRADILALTYKWMEPILLSRGIEEPLKLVLSHGVDYSNMDFSSREASRAELDFTDRFVVTYAGSFSSYYRLPLLLNISEELQKKVPQALILLIGTGPDFQLIQETVTNRNLSNVVLTGGIEPDAVPDYLIASDLFIHPHILPEITDGTKIVEYLAAGKPVLNICLRDGVYGQAETLEIGRSVLPDNIDQFVDAIEYYSINAVEAERIGENAKRMALQNFDRRVIISNFSSQLEQTIKDFAVRQNP